MARRRNSLGTHLGKIKRGTSKTVIAKVESFLKQIQRLEEESQILSGKANEARTEVLRAVNAGERLPTFSELKRSLSFPKKPQIPVLIELEEKAGFPKSREFGRQQRALYGRVDRHINAHFRDPLTLLQRKTVILNYKLWIQWWYERRHRIPQEPLIVRFVNELGNFLQSNPNPTKPAVSMFFRKFHTALTFEGRRRLQPDRRSPQR